MALGRAVRSKRATAEVQGECRAEGSQIKRKLNRNTINLAKLSLVLKNKNKLNVS